MSTTSENETDGLDLGGLNLTGPIAVFCYGSSPGNGREGATAGYACVFPGDPEFTQAGQIDDGEPATNQRAILYAALEALHIVRDIDPENERKLEVFSNSDYLNNAMNKFINTWVRNGWCKSNKKPVKNRKLLKKLLAARGDRVISWKHFKTADDERWAQKAHDKAECLAQDAAPIPAAP